jgi:hypothetical protein
MNASDLSRIVEEIHTESVSSDELDILTKTSDRLEKSNLITALISGEQILCPAREEAASKVMRKLESLASSGRQVGCERMAELWSVSNDLLLHDVATRSISGFTIAIPGI